MTEASKGKIRAGLFAGVFGLVCILITMFVAYMFTSETTTNMELAMSIVGIFTMWMVYVGAYLQLTFLEVASH